MESNGAPRFEVWCCVHWPRDRHEGFDEDFSGELWIKVSMPAILPVGSLVGLPTPRAWDRTCGELSGKISAWALAGGVLVCEIEDTSFIDAETVKELLAIGYTDHSGGNPGEVRDAYKGLFR